MFDLVAHRLRTGGVTGRIRSSGAEYLFYALITATVDHCSPVIDSLGHLVDQLEELLLEGEHQASLDPARTECPAALPVAGQGGDRKTHPRGRQPPQQEGQDFPARHPRQPDPGQRSDRGAEGRNHGTAGPPPLPAGLLGGSVALYAGLRAARGAAWWGICCGVAIGWAVAGLLLLGFLALLVIVMIVYFRRRKWL